MKVRDALSEFLHNADVDQIFTLGSTGILDLLSNIEERGEIDVVHSRHEEGAVSMADGYARAGAGLSVCMIGMGPALAHTGTGLVTARKFGSNMLVIVPAASRSYEQYFPRKRFDRFYEKSFEQDAYLDATIGNVISIESADATIPNLREAVRQIRIGNGPVALQIPMEVFEQEIPDDFTISEISSIGSYSGPDTRIKPDPEYISDAVNLFLDSDVTKVPVILVGAGAVSANAKESIATLAERMNAIIATTLRARGYFADHPYSVGVVGSYGSHVANTYLTEANYILAIGCSLNVRTTDSGYLINDHATIVHVDANENPIERYQPVSLGITGDAQLTAEALNTALEAWEIDRAGEFWTDKLAREIRESVPWSTDSFPEITGRMDPRDLVRYLDETLPEQRRVIVDVGHHARWAIGAIQTEDPRDLIFPGEFASIGLGLYIGLGAALNHDDKATVAFCGDASFLMGIHELDTAVQHNIPILIVVVNDEALGSEYHTLDRAGKYSKMSIQETPDIGAVARAFGATGYTVGSLSEVKDLQDVISRHHESPVVLNCRVNRNITN